MRRPARWLWIPGLALGAAQALVGCASTPEQSGERRLRAAQLAMEVRKVAPGASDETARVLSRVAVEKSAQLRQAYHIQLNHNLHNVLVYWGLKDRGFCWHWQVDLQSALAVCDHPGLDVRRIYAHPGSLFHEHHALVVMPAGGDWRDGLVLDAWRDEGRLWFGPVKTDEYPWLEE